MTGTLNALEKRINACDICADRFVRTQTAHAPRPVFWVSPKAKILVAGQAPGARVHESGKPFTDPSGDRLREWMGVSEAEFYDRSRTAIVPMAFCFPGYDKKGADIPPPAICAGTWHENVLEQLPDVELMLLVGGYAQKWHLGAAAKGGVTKTVANWREHAPGIFPLPHPSWRNTGWLKKNPWFQVELLPQLRKAVRTTLSEKEGIE